MGASQAKTDDEDQGSFWRLPACATMVLFGEGMRWRSCRCLLRLGIIVMMNVRVLDFDGPVWLATDGRRMRLSRNSNIVTGE